MGTQLRLGDETQNWNFKKVAAKKVDTDFAPEPLWKLLFDKIFALTAIIFLSPFIGLIMLLLVLREKGPIFYAHTRIGKGGKPFDCLKFRTMAVDSDALLEDCLKTDPEARRAWELYRKLPEDPRVTCLGKFLRKTSLDELPQFWNVLRGDMSVVGPRPVTLEETPYYGDHLSDYMSVRPGITGPWQVGGRSESGFDERVALDVAYVQDRNLSMDVQIVAKTVKVVIAQDGAC